MALKKLLLALALALGVPASALAQGCVGVGGVNTVPQVGVSCASEPTTLTYGATGTALAVVTGATDFACIAGAAGKVMRIQNIRVSGTVATASVSSPIVVMKRASLDTGGTAATGVALPVAYALDSINAASAATLVSYTANPTINDTSPGIIDGGIVSFNLTTAVGQNPLVFDYSGRLYYQAPTLRAATQQICLNAQATTFTNAVSATVSFRWTEANQ